MGQTNYLKMLWCILYIAFSGFSCWATAESLYMTWPEIPHIACWIVAIGFFLIASFGGWLIAESFNRNNYHKNRTLMFFGGIAIMIFFWIICCLPTNTHTFLYRNVANQIITNDIETTQNYLKQIETNEITDSKVKKEFSELKNEVDSKLVTLKNEIENPLNEGVGPNAKHIMEDFPNILRVSYINPPSTKTENLSVQDKIKFYQIYRNTIYNILYNDSLKIAQQLMPPQKAIMTMKNKAQTCYANLGMVKDAINKGNCDIYDSKDVNNLICNKITDGYVIIKDYQQFVNFQNLQDKAIYTAPNTETKIKHVISVYDLWNDFLFGNHTGGLFMFFCLVISILIDSAAFVFFYLTTKD